MAVRSASDSTLEIIFNDLRRQTTQEHPLPTLGPDEVSNYADRLDRIFGEEYTQGFHVVAVSLKSELRLEALADKMRQHALWSCDGSGAAFPDGYLPLVNAVSDELYDLAIPKGEHWAQNVSWFAKHVLAEDLPCHTPGADGKKRTAFGMAEKVLLTLAPHSGARASFVKAVADRIIEGSGSPLSVLVAVFLGFLKRVEKLGGTRWGSERFGNVVWVREFEDEEQEDILGFVDRFLARKAGVEAQEERDGGSAVAPLAGSSRPAGAAQPSSSPRYSDDAGSSDSNVSMGAASPISKPFYFDERLVNSLGASGSAPATGDELSSSSRPPITFPSTTSSREGTVPLQKGARFLDEPAVSFPDEPIPNNDKLYNDDPDYIVHDGSSDERKVKEQVYPQIWRKGIYIGHLLGKRAYLREGGEWSKIRCDPPWWHNFQERVIGVERAVALGVLDGARTAADTGTEAAWDDFFSLVSDLLQPLLEAEMGKLASDNYLESVMAEIAIEPAYVHEDGLALDDFLNTWGSLYLSPGFEEDSVFNVLQEDSPVGSTGAHDGALHSLLGPVDAPQGTLPHNWSIVAVQKQINRGVQPHNIQILHLCEKPEEHGKTWHVEHSDIGPEIIVLTHRFLHLATAVKEEADQHHKLWSTDNTDIHDTTHGSTALALEEEMELLTLKITGGDLREAQRLEVSEEQRPAEPLCPVSPTGGAGKRRLAAFTEKAKSVFHGVDAGGHFDKKIAIQELSAIMMKLAESSSDLEENSSHRDFYWLRKNPAASKGIRDCLVNFLSKKVKLPPLPGKKTLKSILTERSRGIFVTKTIAKYVSKSPRHPPPDFVKTQPIDVLGSEDRPLRLLLGLVADYQPSYPCISSADVVLLPFHTPSDVSASMVSRVLRIRMGTSATRVGRGLQRDTEDHRQNPSGGSSVPTS